MTQRLVVIGAGGFGREVLELIEDINRGTPSPTYEVVGVLDDGGPGPELLAPLGVTHLGDTSSLEWLPPDVGYVLGIGACRPRRAIDERCRSWGRTAHTLVHPTAVVGRRSVRLGEGSIVCANSTLTTNITLGRHVHVNPNVSVGHDTRVGDYVTLTPQVAVAGNVTIADEVFVGTGARIRPSVHVGHQVVMGAGAVVVNDVSPGLTVAGVPARPMTARP